ncbi:MAG: CsiV family protein [Pseudohongiella sp.]|nr:CsiV family protein [Pseudohongiella sp.]MDO9521566.1 CsiV family protein [Pseudohongiella sp.]MDP2126924.1 CsiV family protein [Pseudohongiella sp.]
MKHAWFRRLSLTAAGLGALMSGLQALGQTQPQADQRWYQIEITLFAHDTAMQAQEHWPMELLAQPLPRNTRPLDSMLEVLSLPAWQAAASQFREDEPLPEPVEIAVPLRTSEFKLPDFERDAFLALPASAHGFTDTNRALTNAADYRVLYHNAWRQPLSGANQAVPVWISAGGLFGDRHELEGTLTFRFNPGQDRVVLDARLWLTQFSTTPPGAGNEISLPELPLSLISRLAQTAANATAIDVPTIQTWYPAQVIPVVNTREMRSNEFHYVDHPAVGIVVHVFPYTPPPLPADSAALL